MALVVKAALENGVIRGRRVFVETTSSRRSDVSIASMALHLSQLH
jgi:hypothetical protein